MKVQTIEPVKTTVHYTRNKGETLYVKRFKEGNTLKMLAFDFGASSGRGILGEIKEGKMILKEVHRFSNDPVQLKNHLQWDFLRLVHEVKQCLLKCKNDGETIDSIGVDTWGVDYGLLDVEGELIGNPFHYRDLRTEPMLEHCFKYINKEDLIQKSGLDCLPYNTIYQLLAETQLNDGPINKAEQMLLMPDLFNYILTGQKRSEYTIATTTQLFDYEKSNWNYELIQMLNLPQHLFAPVIYSGAIVGELTAEIITELDIKSCKVISVGSHDTASAIAAIPAETDDFIFISTGTWVMVGVEAESLTVNETTKAYGLSNEGSASGKVNLLRNIMGLWLMQECKRQWLKEGCNIDYPEMVAEGLKAQVTCVINPDDPTFYAPGNMPEKIKNYCRMSNQQVPESVGEIVRAIAEGLALRISHTIEGLEEATGKTYEVIHMFGGGIQDVLFCQTVADFTGKKVITGPKEATAMGNILLQGMGLGYIKDLQEGRAIVRASIEIKTYEPQAVEDLEIKSKKFLQSEK